MTLSNSPFLWRGKPSIFAEHIAESPMARKAGPGRGIKRPVEQLTLEGEVVRQFPSLLEAARSMGTHESNIHRVITGARKSAGGYSWRYVTKEEQVLADRWGGAYSKAIASKSDEQREELIEQTNKECEYHFALAQKVTDDVMRAFHRDEARRLAKKASALILGRSESFDAKTSEIGGVV